MGMGLCKVLMGKFKLKVPSINFWRCQMHYWRRCVGCRFGVWLHCLGWWCRSTAYHMCRGILLWCFWGDAVAASLSNLLGSFMPLCALAQCTYLGIVLKIMLSIIFGCNFSLDWFWKLVSDLSGLIELVAWSRFFQIFLLYEFNIVEPLAIIHLFLLEIHRLII